ncbi:MAG: CBS domain-containing protein [Solirubrobacteraceae bacterium]
MHDDQRKRSTRALRPQQPLSELLARFGSERTNALPVTDRDGKLLGIVAAGDLEQAISRKVDEQRHTAAALMREAPALHTHDSLEHAVLALGSTDDEALPVLSPEDDRLIAWLTHRRVLNAYRQHTRSS